MKFAILIGLALLSGCAYGEAPDPQPTYGHTNPYQDGGNGDGGSSNWGDPSGNQGSVPYGCFLEVVYQQDVPTFSFVYCPSEPQMSYKWIPDPSPFDKENP